MTAGRPTVAGARLGRQFFGPQQEKESILILNFF
jgi:hypothetical protein